MRSTAVLVPWLLAALACLAWIRQSDSFSAFHGMALLLCLVGMALACRDAIRPVNGVLGWDGQAWSLEMGGRLRLGDVRARLDWQQGLLLEFLAAGGGRQWIWLERRSAPVWWDGLRRAVYAEHGPAVAAPAEPRRGEAGP